MGETELQTIRKAAAGDRMAFRALVLEHSHAVFRVAWRLTGDEALAEDIVQEAFLKAWQKLGEFRMDASFRSWLSRVTVNTAMDHLRQRSRRRQFEAETPDWVPEAAGSPAADPDRQLDIHRRTEAAMRQLTENERAALLLRHYEGHSIGEIAQILEMTTGACKQTVFRAVRKMRAALAPLVTT